MRSKILVGLLAYLPGVALGIGLLAGATPVAAQIHMGNGYPYGNWTNGSYYYRPHAGFGLNGLYSWHYGRPFATPYPYHYYGSATPFSRIVGYYGVSETNVYGQTQYYPFSGSDPASGAGGRHDAWMSGYQQARRDDRSTRPTVAIVRLRIEPKETALFLDGNPIGSAQQFSRRQADLKLPPGKYFLEAALDGYTVFGEELNLSAGQSLLVARQLPKSGAPVPDLNAARDPAHPGTPTRPTGILLLSGSPDDARVLLDGRFLCYGSMVGDASYLHRLPAGPHTIEVSKSGYRTVREEILISPLRPVERKIVLARE